MFHFLSKCLSINLCQSLDSVQGIEVQVGTQILFQWGFYIKYSLQIKSWLFLLGWGFASFLKSEWLILLYIYLQIFNCDSCSEEVLHVSCKSWFKSKVLIFCSWDEAVCKVFCQFVGLFDCISFLPPLWVSENKQLATEFLRDISYNSVAQNGVCSERTKEKSVLSLCQVTKRMER